MKTTLRSDDLSCPTCVDTIEFNLNQIEGVTEARVHFNTGRIEVEHVPDTVSEEKLIEVVQRSGYEARVCPF